MTTTPPTTPYERAVQAAIDALHEEMCTYTPEQKTLVYGWLLRLRVEQRMYYLSAAMATEEIWPTLRNDRLLLDTIVSAATGFMARLSADERRNHAATLARAIGGLTLGVLTNGRKNGRVTDNNFAEKIKTESELEALLTHEGWLLFVVTLERNIGRFVPIQRPGQSPKRP